MRFPDTAVCLAAEELVRLHEPAFLYNHSVRSFAFGRAAGEILGKPVDEEMLFLGSIFHDVGLVDQFFGPDRFEINGADAAASFLSDRGYSDKKIAVIWDAIALHSTLSVPQRKQPEIALVQMGAGIDMGAMPRSLLTEEIIERILAEYPRVGFKTAMIEALAAAARRNPHSGVINLVGEVGRRHAGLPIPEFVDICMNAEFEE
jgi:hypothetical protein